MQPFLPLRLTQINIVIPNEVRNLFFFYLWNMKTLNINIPETVDFDSNDALMAIAFRLYDKGKLTLVQVANMVRLTKATFMELLANYGVDVFNYKVSDLDRDVENIRLHSKNR